MREGLEMVHRFGDVNLWEDLKDFKEIGSCEELFRGGPVTSEG